MNCYKLSTIFSFGKYKGKTLKQVYKKNPSYVDWCLRNVDFFTITQSTLNKLQEINSKWILSIFAQQSVINKVKNQQAFTDYNRYSYQHDINRWRIAQHPELNYRSEHEAIKLIDLADEIGCEPEDLIANLDM
ncbi:MAG: hypothetical protein U9P73_07850 [Candidatus Cloacimonadota bacterium]|nr:hypothetical protein [Candidatus Cloacimonadota bacterium]